MKKINLAITGCLGRMGQQIIKSSRSNRNFKLVALTENKPLNKKIAGIKIDLNTEQSFEKTDVIIDFTVPKCTLEMLKIASRLKKRVIIGTTGFTQKEENLIKKYSKKIPILKAGNMSLGVNLLMYLTEIASESLGDNYLSKVFEIHHKHKKDYPSGTALMLGKGIADAALGTTIEIPTIDGGKAKIKIPDGTQNGKQFRLKGKGMPYMRGSGNGDLYVQVNTEVPISLNKAQKELLEKFREIENEKSNPSIKKFFQKAKSFWKN